METSNTKGYVLAGFFIALMAISAYVKIPTPYVPVTFQLIVAITSGIILGPYLGALSMSVYVILGLIGLPIFSGGGGFGYVLMTTFGFIIGFIFSSFVAGLLWRKSVTMRILSIIASIIVCYILGILWFWMIMTDMTLLGSMLFMVLYAIKDVALGAVLFGTIHILNFYIKDLEVRCVQ